VFSSCHTLRTSFFYAFGTIFENRVRIPFPPLPLFFRRGILQSPDTLFLLYSTALRFCSRNSRTERTFITIIPRDHATPDIKMMAAHIFPAQVSSRSESISSSPPDFALPVPLLFNFIRDRSARRRTVGLHSVEEQFPKQTRRASILRKLAGPRENAKRFLRLRSSGIQSPSPPHRLPPRSTRPRPVSEIILSPGDRIFSAASDRPDSTMATDVLPRAVQDPPTATATPELTTPFQPLRNEKIVATGSGLSVGIALTEPVLYLQGYDQNDPSSKKSAILRGQIHLKVTKCVKIKKISICFRGHAQTDWPDGATCTHPHPIPAHTI